MELEDLDHPHDPQNPRVPTVWNGSSCAPCTRGNQQGQAGRGNAGKRRVSEECGEVCDVPLRVHACGGALGSARVTGGWYKGVGDARRQVVGWWRDVGRLEWDGVHSSEDE